MKRILFRLIPSLACLAIAVAVALSLYEDPVERGLRLHVEAWSATFEERGLPVPPQGPREGVWGKRLGPKAHDAVTGWHEPAVSIPGLVEVDASGFQHLRTSETPSLRIAIIGGSVAFGACASGTETAYFATMARELAGAGVSVDLTTVAAGAWKSSQEVQALKLHLKTLRPDVVLILDGLNDLTNGATATALHGQYVPMPDGSQWTADSHAHDYPDRVQTYLSAIRETASIADAASFKLIVALQPALFEKTPLSRRESGLLKNSLAVYGSEGDLETCYEAMRAGLTQLEKSRGLKFVDASRAFDGVEATTFCDLWHFTDPGHETLGGLLARAILSALGQSR